MFSEEWDLEFLNQRADQILQELLAEGLVKTVMVPGLKIELPASANIEHVQSVMFVCSGYPEIAGVWSYSLLEQSMKQKELLEKTSMAPYFRETPENVGLIVLNPHVHELKSPPETSIPEYLFQLDQLYNFFNRSKNVKIILLGYSLGGEVILRFLQENLSFVEKTHKLIFIDPTPPSIGRRKLENGVLELVDQALFYGLCDGDGNPGEFAEFTKMRLKIQPNLIPCQSHGEMPNLIWPQLQKELRTIVG
ncbi:MAG: hypothetical protein HQM13_17595 [SAR324 cluster bacterium]|nr:hypothetical protein [SAR324 cluster bacterium]